MSIPALEEPSQEWLVDFNRRVQAIMPNAVWKDGRWSQLNAAS